MSASHRTRSRLQVALCGLLVAAHSGAAQGIAFRLEGTVRNVFERNGHTIGAPIVGGDPFVATLSYDETAAPDPHDFCRFPGEDPGCAYYVLPAVSAVLRVEVSGFVFGNAGDIQASVFVNAGGLWDDSFVLVTEEVTDPSPATLDRHMQLWFRGPPEGEAIVSTDLPTSLDLAAFEPVHISWRAGPSRSDLGINFDITSIEVVPEPGVASLVGLGLGGLSLIARRRRKS